MRYDLNLLKAFDALYKERNVTRAAELINVSQPAMSAILARLRELFHDPLFIRDKFGMSPTEKARYIHPVLEKALSELDSVVFGEQELDLRNEKRTFSIAANDYFQMVILPRVLTCIREQAPLIKIMSLPYLQDMADNGIMSGQTDFAFGRHYDPPENLVAVQAMTDNLACLASINNSRIGDDTKISLALFEELQHVVVKPAGKLKTGIFKILQKYNIKRDTACTVSNFNSVPGIVENTNYLAVLPKRLCQQLAKSHSLRVYELPTKIANLRDFPFHLSWHRRYQNDPAHRWLRQQILQCCQFKG